MLLWTRFVCGLFVLTTFAAAEEPYPLSRQLEVLSHDLTSTDYHAVLATMIPTDLRAEWQRVATPDNYHLFLKQYGQDVIDANPVLKQAYERRKDIADRFLALVRDAYAAKKQKPPFADEALLIKVLESGDRRGKTDERSRVTIAPILPTLGAEKQWPSFRGPTQQGIVLTGTEIKGWETRWKTLLPGRGNSSPIVWGNSIFLTTEGPRPETGDAGPERFLLALGREDGHILWKHAAPSPQEVEKLYWKNTFASSTMVTDGERVIAFLGNSGLVCCDLDGHRLWHTDLGLFPTMHGPGTTPVLYDDLVIVVQDQTKGTSLCAAYDKRTGKQRWKVERPNQAGWSNPVLLCIDGQDELIYNGANIVISYEPATGKELWRVSGSSEESIPMIVSGGGMLFSMSGRNGPMMAIRPGGRGDITTSHIAWRNERGGPHVPTPAYVDGRLFIVNDTGIATCLDATTGETVWQQRLRGRFSMSPLILGDKLLVISEDGVVTIFRASDSYESLEEHDLGETVLATPAIVGGRIYVRTAENMLCLGER